MVALMALTMVAYWAVLKAASTDGWLAELLELWKAGVLVGVRV